MIDDALAAWATLDATRALHPADHLALGSTESARSLVMELLAASMGPRGSRREAAGAGAWNGARPEGIPGTGSDDDRDLWNACARLGRMMEDEGASPSLAAVTIDHAALALGLSDPARISPARASLLEGYVASVREAERTTAAAAWDYPRCVVAIEDGVVAIACGRPTDDPDALTAWAEHIARKLSRAKVKRAVLEGADAARAELASALELVGIALGPAPASKSWLPWKR